MRAAGVRGGLIYCSDYRCNHSICLDADRWPDDIRLSNFEPRFVRVACGRRVADVRRDWQALAAAKTPALIARCRRQQMTEFRGEFDFLADDSVDKDTEKLLLGALLEVRRYERDAAQKIKEIDVSLAFKKKKFWHNTPLMLALVGTITVFANGLVAYVHAAQLPVVGIEQIEFNKVVEIGEPGDAAPYTEVQQDDGHWMAVREKPQGLLRRLEGKTLMVNFTRPNGKTVWVKAAAVAQVRDSDSEFGGPAKTQLLLVNRAMQAVTESPPIVAAAIVAEASLKK